MTFTALAAGSAVSAQTDVPLTCASMTIGDAGQGPAWMAKLTRIDA